MAGIGFELRKLFVGRGVIRKLRAYTYAGVICSGTMALTIALLLILQYISRMFGASLRQRELFHITMVYALFLSMMLSSFFQTYLSRYVADMIYQEKPEKIIPSLIGASIVLMIPGGVLYALLLQTSGDLSALQKLLNWMLFMELVPLWLQMTYITAAKDYRAIVAVFATGVALVFGMAFVLLWMGGDVTTSLQISLVVGYGMMLVGFMRVLLRYFPVGEGSAFAFVGWLSYVPDLLLTGFFGLAGAFAHVVIMWFSPMGEVVTGAFRQASQFDAAAFYAFLVTIPTNVNFVVSVEVNFYGKYRRYFSEITGGGTIRKIEIARESMCASLQQEVNKLVQIQLFALIAYMLFMRYFLSARGFGADMIHLFLVLSIGFSAFALGNSLMLLLLYFNDRKGALTVSGIFFAANLIGSLLSFRGPALFYGIGLPAGGLLMFLAARLRLNAYVRRIDFHVFCAQPIFNVDRVGWWLRLAQRLDQRALQRSAVQRKGIEQVAK